MDDYISRQALLDKFEPWLKVKDYNDGELNMLKAILYEIRFMRSAQPEIIRCKDCKYARLTKDGSCKYCDIWFPDEAEYMDGDYYCASAERKSNG